MKLNNRGTKIASDFIKRIKVVLLSSVQHFVAQSLESPGMSQLRIEIGSSIRPRGKSSKSDIIFSILKGSARLLVIVFFIFWRG